MTSGHVARVRKLFKLILRLHRNLPNDLRVLGDNYAKEEFKRHKNCKPKEAHIFLHEWQDYAARMLRQASPMQAHRPAQGGEVGGRSSDAGAGAAGKLSPRFGDDLSPDVVVRFAPDQLFNLYMLLANARGIHPHENSDTEPPEESLDADAYVNIIKEARRNMIEFEKIERDKVARGVIKNENKTFNSAQWVQLFDIAVEMKDMVDSMNATGAAEIANRKVEKIKPENANKDD